MESNIDLTVLLDDFQRELDKTKEFFTFFDDMHQSIKSTEDELKSDKNKLNIITKTLQQVRDIIHKFNSKVDETFDEYNNNDSDEMQQNAEHKCQITHIVDAIERTCYVVDLNGDTLKQLSKFWKEAPFQELPYVESTELEDIFAIEIDSNFNRARFVVDTKMNSIRARLIDTGEIIDIGDYRLQKLPDDIKSIRAGAQLCKIHQIGSEESQPLSIAFKGQIFDYRIRTFDENSRMFHIDIYSTNPFLVGYTPEENWITFNDLDGGTKSDTELKIACENDVRSNLEQTINKTLQSKWNVTEKSLFTEASIYNSNYDLNDNTSNDFESVENRNAIASPAPSSSTSLDDLGGAASLELQQSIADKKSISIKNHWSDSTSNWRSSGNKRQANINHDDSRSKSYEWQQHRTYGSNMTHETVHVMKTQCETNFLQSHHNQLKLPDTGEDVTIIPTCVLSCTEFYGQLGSYFQTLEYSQHRLNTRRARYEYEPYTQMPEKMSNVMVLLENGFFHRAKVLDVRHDQKMNEKRIIVFLLDYGTTHALELRYIFKWTEQCDKFPNMVVLFRLFNILVKNPNDPNVIQYVKRKIPKTFVSANIMRIDDHSISVRLFDDQQFDIGEEINCSFSN